MNTTDRRVKVSMCPIGTDVSLCLHAEPLPAFCPIQPRPRPPVPNKLSPPQLNNNEITLSSLPRLPPSPLSSEDTDDDCGMEIEFEDTEDQTDIDSDEEEEEEVEEDGTRVLRAVAPFFERWALETKRFHTRAPSELDIVFTLTKVNSALTAIARAYRLENIGLKKQLASAGRDKQEEIEHLRIELSIERRRVQNAQKENAEMATRLRDVAEIVGLAQTYRI